MKFDNGINLIDIAHTPANPAKDPLAYTRQKIQEEVIQNQQKQQFLKSNRYLFF